MITIKQVSRAVLALTAAVAASGAMAASATVQLDAALMGANGVTATALGADTYNSGTGVLLAPIDAANTTLTVTDFGNLDGFSLAFDILGFPQTAAFSNFSFDSLTKTLSGNLLGGGIVASKIDYKNGGLLVAGTSTVVGNDIVFSNFSVAAELSAYLTSKNISTAQLSAVTSVLKTVSLPSAVPEPSTYVLMGLGLVGIALTARKRAQA